MRLMDEVDRLGPAQVVVSKSQIALRRAKNFAVVWIPATHLRHGGPRLAPLVLALSFSQRDPSPRWKEITQVSPKRYTHHLELWSVDDVNEEVRGWLRAAWDAAG